VRTIAEGTRAPDLDLPDEDGHPVRLSERLEDGPVVLSDQSAR
jgi:peroxiredoxin